MIQKNREAMERAKVSTIGRKFLGNKKLTVTQPLFQEREDEPVDDSAVVDDMFGFLPNYQNEDTISESQAPSAFRDLPAPKVVQNGDIIPGTVYYICVFIIHT